MLKPYTIEGRYESGFEEATRGKICAFVALAIDSTATIKIPGSPFGLGIAVANEQGYTPVPAVWCHSDNMDEMREHAKALNHELFHLDDVTAIEIILSTMRRRSRVRA